MVNWKLLVEVSVKPEQLFLAVLPDYKSVSKGRAGEGLVDLMVFSSMYPMNKLAMMGERGEPMATPPVCS